MRGTILASTLLAAMVAACGGGGSEKPDGAYENKCGPVDDAKAEPNTLLRQILFPATLTKDCSPYFIDGPVTVQAELTIEPGVVIKACQGGCRSRITVASDGKLLATGTAAEPIRFTSVYIDNPIGPPYGQWTGILFLNSRPGSHLEHVIVEHAGGPYSALDMGNEFERYEFPVEGSILNDSTENVQIVDVWVRKSRGYAFAATTDELFDLDKKNIYEVFDRVTLTDNLQGFWLPVSQGGTLGADVCFAERDQAGACPGQVSPPAGNFIELHIDDNFGRTPENVNKDATWKPYAVPYVVENINITSGALLRVQDGVEIRMTDLGGITVGLNDPGALEMVAAAPGGIKVTSHYENPTPSQYWNGLYLWDKTDAARTRIENVDLGYGGRRSPVTSEAAALIGIFSTDPTIVGNHVHHSRAAGIHWNCIANPKGLEEPPANTNTSEDGTIPCAGAIGSGIAENYGCTCPGGGCSDRCPPP